MYAQILTLKSSKPEFVGKHSVPTAPVSGITIDTRASKPGELYFALRGENHDGHAFVLDALKKGAPACVVDREYWIKNKNDLIDKPIFIVNDTLVALQELANTHRNQFSVPLIGLTGTNGKTTSKEMIAAVLNQAGNTCKTMGNFNNHIGTPLTLLRLDKSHEYAVIEMGTNHFGEITTLCEIAEPNFGLITNIGHGHTEHLQNIQGVARAKMELYDYLYPDGVIFANLDDAMIAGQIGKYKGAITFGLDAPARIKAERRGMDENGLPMMSVQGEEIRLNLIGSHNLINALSAVAIGLEFGLSMARIREGLQNVELPPKRMGIIRKHGLTILNDCYNANPESTLAALKTLSEIKSSGQKWLVMGDMLELGEQAAAAHANIGRAISEYGVTGVVAYGPLSANMVAAAKASSPKVDATHFADKSQLLQYLKKNIGSEDTLLVKGSRGMQMEDVISELVGDKN